jgi:hypothetical protein
MSTDAVYILVVIAFFVVLAVGVGVVGRVLEPGRDWPKAPERAKSARVSRRLASQTRPSPSPVEKRKPTPGSVST